MCPIIEPQLVVELWHTAPLLVPQLLPAVTTLRSSSMMAMMPVLFCLHLHRREQWLDHLQPVQRLSPTVQQWWLLLPALQVMLRRAQMISWWSLMMMLQ